MAVRVIVIIVSVAVLLGLLVEGASIIFSKSSIIYKLKLNKEDNVEVELNQPVTKRDIQKILKEIENLKATKNLQTSPHTQEVSDECEKDLA